MWHWLITAFLDIVESIAKVYLEYDKIIILPTIISTGLQLMDNGLSTACTSDSKLVRLKLFSSLLFNQGTWVFGF